MDVTIFEGATFKDHRGSVTFVNDFKFDNIERFYVISNSEENPIRAWQGHKLDAKNFYCVSGTFKVCFVKIDNWDDPSPSLKVESIVLDENETRILHIPAGYANAIISLKKDSKLISFSTLPLDKVKDDDVRYASDIWSVNG